MLIAKEYNEFNMPVAQLYITVTHSKHKTIGENAYF